MEKRGKRLPDLIEDHRDGDKEAREKGEFNHGKKSLWDSIGHQIDVKGCIAQVAEQYLREREDDGR